MTKSEKRMHKMSPAELSEVFTKHASWRRGEEGGVRATLIRANLDGANLGGADLRSADLTGANLRSADLTGANLYDANLRGADLGGATLGGATLDGANLGGANLRSADLTGANLYDATGNMREMRSAQFDRWPVTIIVGTMQIGCQRHSLDLWRKADPRWIAALDPDATTWWAKWGTVCLAMAEGF